MRRTLILLLMLLLCLAGHAGAEALFSWTLELGEDGITTPEHMLSSMDGGVVIVGSTTSTDGSLGEADGFVLRVDAQGEVLWKARLGGSGEDILTTAVEMTEGRVLALGTTLSTDGHARASRGGMDAWLVLLDAQGEVIWSKTLGGSADDELTVVQATEEDMIFVCGRTQSRNGDLGANFGGWDAWAALLSAEDGKPLWTYRYGFEGDDRIVMAHPMHDGWLMIGEASEAAGTDAEDNPIYNKRPFFQMISVEGEAALETPITLGSTGDNQLHMILETEAGWLLGGETNSRSALMPPAHGKQDIWITQLRQSATASMLWQRTFGGSLDEKLYAIVALPEGGFLLLASTESTDGQVFGAHGDGDVWLLCISSTGILEWQQPIGGSALSIPTALLRHEGGDLFVIGTTLSQDGDIGRHPSVRTGFISRLSSNGNLLTTRTVTDGAECTLLEARVNSGRAYLLGSVREITSEGATESLWLSQLAEEGFLSE